MRIVIRLTVVLVALATGLAAAQLPPPTGPAVTAFNDGVALHDSGKYVEAIEPLERAVKLRFQPIN